MAFLQGTWLGHPLHPMLVHVPTGLWPAALLFDGLSLTGIGGIVMAQLSFYAILLGLIGALLAAPAGWADWMEIRQGRPARKIGFYHMILNGSGVILWAMNFWLRADTFRTATAVELFPFALSILGTMLVLISGYLGGRMVYDHGIAVARFSKKEWRRAAAVSGANLSSE